MRSDPRCPHCNEKVSATASWCMHCGADFAEPVDANGNDLAAVLERSDSDDLMVLVGDSEYGQRAVGIVVGAIALFTLPIVSPPGTTLLYLVAVVGVGYLTAQRETVADAVDRGAQLLALVPFLLWLFAAFSGRAVGIGVLVGPVVYAALALFVARRVRERLEA
ncbi:zinc ribbon domain-containing protein [Halomicroarcula sp. GCM10025324]|uniref:zinc ribbon domain-containing protein n=1 Tax=Haloarcula TaxID=2237 RepID=UPI0023E8DDD3|nr:zinc ribbon domain-containing protein [Halomicroarcula sp. ZS-22-S1]